MDYSVNDEFCQCIRDKNMYRAIHHGPFGYFYMKDGVRHHVKEDMIFPAFRECCNDPEITPYVLCAMTDKGPVPAYNTMKGKWHYRIGEKRLRCNRNKLIIAKY